MPDTTPIPSPPTLAYAPAPKILVRFGRLALGSAALAIYPVPLLCSKWFPADEHVGQSVFTLAWLSAAVALLVGVWLFSSVLPRPLAALPRPHTVLRTLALFNVLFAVLDCARELFDFFAPLPQYVRTLLGYTIVEASFALPFALSIAGIIFMFRVAQRARVRWAGIVAACALAAFALEQLLQLIIEAVNINLRVSGAYPKWFFRLTPSIPFSAIYETNLFAQLALWTLLALWSTRRWCAARSANSQLLTSAH
jgi:hypothetical protein